MFFSGGLRVDGAVRGNVAALPDQPGTLVVSEQARIDGEVQAAHVVVNGTINGPVDARETLELQASSRVKGDVHYKSIEIQQGAVDRRAPGAPFRRGQGGRTQDREVSISSPGKAGMQTMNAVTEMPDPLVFSDNAANKVKQLIEEEGNPELKLRVFVTGGGCSGFQYGFTFDEVQNDDDSVMEKNGVQLLIDPMSYQYLSGAEIDYTEGLEGAQFVIKNPNATSTCGCGSSFSA